MVGTTSLRGEVVGKVLDVNIRTCHILVVRLLLYETKCEYVNFWSTHLSSVLVKH